MKELDEREKQLDYRNAYKNSNGKGNLKTIPEGDNENFSKKFTEEGDKMGNYSINNNKNNNNFPGPGGKNYLNSPACQINQLPSSPNINTSNNKQTDLVYSSDNDEDNNNFQKINKKYGHNKKDSKLSDYESHNIHQNNNYNPKDDMNSPQNRGLNSDINSDGENYQSHGDNNYNSENEMGNEMRESNTQINVLFQI